MFTIFMCRRVVVHMPVARSYRMLTRNYRSYIKTNYYTYVLQITRWKLLTVLLPICSVVDEFSNLFLINIFNYLTLHLKFYNHMNEYQVDSEPKIN